ESRVLKNFSDTEKLEYSLFAAPWPASDRDFVYRKKLLHKDDEKIIFVMKVEESELMPEQDGVVRAEMIESLYTLTSITDKQTNVELIFYADPKGWLPDWVINKIQQVLPYRMLRGLKARSERMIREKARLKKMQD
ncbi:MAG: START domain-containing protein, partial [Gammaproteobacteria bacterium]|nr:START domain-containing protein [Gammaproteobacteria bacterium]